MPHKLLLQAYEMCVLLAAQIIDNPPNFDAETPRYSLPRDHIRDAFSASTSASARPRYISRYTCD